MPYGLTQGIEPSNGRTSVSSSAKPITQVGNISSSNTTFTSTSVVDATAWDLSLVEPGMLIKTSDGYRAIIDTVNDGTNTLTIRKDTGWAKGTRPIYTGAGKPANGSTVRIHKRGACLAMIVDALDTNSADVFIGTDNTVTVSGGANPGHPISYQPTYPNHRVTMEAEKHIDLTEVWVIAASAQEIAWVALG